MSFDVIRDSMGPAIGIWLTGLLVFVLAAATLEGLVQSFVRRQSYDWRAYGASLARFSDVALAAKL